MKKIITAICLSAAVLTGCDKTGKSNTNNDTTTAPATTAADTAEAETTTEEESEVATIAEVTAPPTTHEADVPAGGIKDMSPAIYEQFLRSKFEETAAENNGLAYIEYGYRDIDADGIPELFLKRGTCEADFSITAYTLDSEGEVVQIGELGGGHTSVDYDETLRMIVTFYAQMGSAHVSCFDYENGRLVEKEPAGGELSLMQKYEAGENEISGISFVSVYRSDNDDKGYSFIPLEGEKKDGLHFDYYKWK